MLSLRSARQVAGIQTAVRKEIGSMDASIADELRQATRTGAGDDPFAVWRRKTCEKYVGGR